jgi:hypothetical protein
VDVTIAPAPSPSMTRRVRDPLVFVLAGAALVIGHRLVLLGIFALVAPDHLPWQLGILVAWVLLTGGIAALGYVAGTRRSRLDVVAGVGAAALMTLVLGLVGW